MPIKIIFHKILNILEKDADIVDRVVFERRVETSP